MILFSINSIRFQSIKFPNENVDMYNCLRRLWICFLLFLNCMYNARGELSAYPVPFNVYWVRERVLEKNEWKKWPTHIIFNKRLDLVVIKGDSSLCCFWLFKIVYDRFPCLTWTRKKYFTLIGIFKIMR